MSSVEFLREFVTERLTAAAEEIFGVFAKTIVEYQEEIERQRRLLDVVWKPEIKLHRIAQTDTRNQMRSEPQDGGVEKLWTPRKAVDFHYEPPALELPRQNVCKEEEVVTDQQLCNQEKNSSLDPEPPQIKKEQEELCTGQEGQQLVLKQETETFMLISPYEEGDDREPGPKSDHHLLSHSSAVAESQDQEGSQHVDSGSTRTSESQPKKECHNNTSHSSNADNSPIQCNTGTGKKSLQCGCCGKAFRAKSILNIHLRVHTGEQPYVCKTCGKRFTQLSSLNAHFRVHTGEKPHVCHTCGKRFARASTLNVHVRIHTGEKPYLCKICGKRFNEWSKLKRHIIIHTGEKPYLCSTCGNQFNQQSKLNRHMIMHTSGRPYSCDTCGKRFKDTSTLNAHVKIHTCERPFLCKICGKRFNRMTHLKSHMKVHTR